MLGNLNVDQQQQLSHRDKLNSIPVASSRMPSTAHSW
jgi:hypothetical protein